jgi:hypothetical protein
MESVLPGIISSELLEYGSKIPFLKPQNFLYYTHYTCDNLQKKIYCAVPSEINYFGSFWISLSLCLYVCVPTHNLCFVNEDLKCLHTFF